MKLNKIFYQTLQPFLDCEFLPGNNEIRKFIIPSKMIKAIFKPKLNMIRK
jgi:hypothetical protein